MNYFADNENYYIFLNFHVGRGIVYMMNLEDKKFPLWIFKTLFEKVSQCNSLGTFDDTRALICQKFQKTQFPGFVRPSSLEGRMEPLAPWGEYKRSAGLHEYRPHYGGHREVGNGGNLSNGGNRILNEG